MSLPVTYPAFTFDVDGKGFDESVFDIELRGIWTLGDSAATSWSAQTAASTSWTTVADASTTWADVASVSTTWTTASSASTTWTKDD